MDVDSDDDPVVKELDVYYSNELAKNLYLLQFPIRPIEMNYDKCKYISARIKPVSKRIELEVSLDTKNANYSQSKGEQFATNVDGKLPQLLTQHEKYYKSNVMDKQIFHSSNAAPSSIQKHYYSGVLNGESELHLTPLNGVHQMRPSFEYFDISEKKFKDAKDAVVAQEAEYLTEEELDADLADKTELITIKYAKDTKNKRESTQNENENWINLAYSRSADPGSIEHMSKLLCKNKNNQIKMYELVPDYIDKLLGVESQKPAQEIKNEQMQL